MTKYLTSAPLLIGGHRTEYHRHLLQSHIVTTSFCFFAQHDQVPVDGLVRVAFGTLVVAGRL